MSIFKVPGVNGESSGDPVTDGDTINMATAGTKNKKVVGRDIGHHENILVPLITIHSQTSFPSRDIQETVLR